MTSSYKKDSQPALIVFDVLGTPLVALLIAVVVGMFTFGVGVGMSRDQLAKCVASGLPPVAGIILIVAAGGGFKQILVDSGIGTMLADWAKGAHVSVLLLAWVIAALIRLATGSATVATVTASSLMLGLVEGMSSGHVALVVLAVGAGSLFFSHVNDAGFWLVNQYFGMTVGQTIKMAFECQVGRSANPASPAPQGLAAAGISTVTNVNEKRDARHCCAGIATFTLGVSLRRVVLGIAVTQKPNELAFAYDLTLDEARRRTAVLEAIGDDWDPIQALTEEELAWDMLYSGLDDEQQRMYDELVSAGVLPDRAANSVAD